MKTYVFQYVLTGNLCCFRRRRTQRVAGTARRSQHYTRGVGRAALAAQPLVSTTNYTLHSTLYERLDTSRARCSAAGQCLLSKANQILLAIISSWKIALSSSTDINLFTPALLILNTCIGQLLRSRLTLPPKIISISFIILNRNNFRILGAFTNRKIMYTDSQTRNNYV